MEPLTEISYALDTFYFLVCGALVMWMAAGFAMLEAGMVRAKNTAEILTKNISLFAIACVMYMLVGYNLMYPGDNVVNSLVPNLGFLLGTENAAESMAGDDAPYYAARSDFFFQVVFVATAMSIVSGAVAERMKLWSFLLFAVVFTSVIYPVQGYWKWGGGYLQQMGFQDFAGSGVVHMCGAVAALVGVQLLGARKGKYSSTGSVNPIPGANMPLAALGTFVLWLGWFGFNGGSQLKLASFDDANAVAAIFVNTNMSAAGGVIAALLTVRFMWGKADLTMALNGALAGLVAITAEPLAPTPLVATLIGAAGGILVVISIIAFDRAKIDDPVGAISVHGVVGVLGFMVVPFTNSDASFTAQGIGLLLIFTWTLVTSFVLWGIIKAIFGLRVSEEAEYEGVDISECGIEAYPEFARGK